MFASKTVFYGFAAVLAFVTTYSLIPMESPAQQASSNMEERVIALEEQVADLSARIAVLETQTVTPTATAGAGGELPAQVPSHTEGEEENSSPSTEDYQSVLDMVDTLDCKITHFRIGKSAQESRLRISMNL